MMMRTIVFLWGFAAWISEAEAVERPNVVLIITDDQGYGDLGCHGNPVIQTPNLDRLHAESVRLTDFHVDPTCSPTRGALMSGKYSHRAKVWHTIAGGNHLRAGEMTMADAFRETGYRTGMFGKWHLGSNYPYRPMDRGFDEWLGHGDGGTGTADDYFTNDRVNDVCIHNGERERLEGYAPDVFYDAAITFIRKARTDKTPFFAYVSTYVPHGPHTIADRSWVDKYEAEVGKGMGYFFASIERVDRNIGRLRQALAEEGIEDNTILIFMTDNGGTAGVKLFNAGMRGQKGSAYEGGHRVPFFIRWPAGGLAHGSDVTGMNAHFDVLPTLIDLCRLTLQRTVDFDGRSFMEVLQKPATEMPERTLFVEKQRTFQPEKWKAAVAMRGPWRLVNGRELYNLENDPGQKRNVANKHPEMVENLKTAFDDYWVRVTPDDRGRVRFVVGHPDDPETFLQPADWHLPSVPWNHAQISRGAKQAGSWWIKAEREGVYRFEVRRWPVEVAAPITGVPVVDKTIDAWDPGGGKATMIYAGEKAPFVALPVAFVRLNVGEFEEVRKVGGEDAMITFDVSLEQQDYEVKAEFLDARKKVIAGGYYVYCRKRG